jgi:hypothetical protein
MYSAVLPGMQGLTGLVRDGQPKAEKQARSSDLAR